MGLARIDFANDCEAAMIPSCSGCSCVLFDWPSVLQVAGADEASIMAGDKAEQTRWVVPAKGSQLLVMQFQSEDMGGFKENLVFEV